MTNPAQDYVTWTIPRNMLTEHSMSGIAYQHVLDQNAILTQQNKQNAIDLTARDVTINLLTATNKLQSEKLKEALDRIETLVKTPVNPAPVPPLPPAPVVPGPVVPVISRTELRNVAGVTITKDDTPGTSQDEMTRQLLEICGKTGFNVWRGLLNIEEVKKHSAYTEDDPRNLPAFGRRHGMAFMVDSVDTQAKRVTDGKLTKAGYAEYYAGLKKLGCTAVYMNDVDDKAKALFIHDWIDLTQEAMTTARLDVPLIGSFMATFDRGRYPGFSHYETQCFGTPGELRGFLARHDVDVFCLDGQRSASVAELKVNNAIVLAADINNLFVYTGFDGDKPSETDWREMTGEVAEQKDMLTKWKIQRTKITAQLTEQPGS